MTWKKHEIEILETWFEFCRANNDEINCCQIYTEHGGCSACEDLFDEIKETLEEVNTIDKKKSVEAKNTK